MRSYIRRMQSLARATTETSHDSVDHFWQDHECYLYESNNSTIAVVTCGLVSLVFCAHQAVKAHDDTLSFGHFSLACEPHTCTMLGIEISSPLFVCQVLNSLLFYDRRFFYSSRPLYNLSICAFFRTFTCETSLS